MKYGIILNQELPMCLKRKLAFSQACYWMREDKKTFILVKLKRQKLVRQ